VWRQVRRAVGIVIVGWNNGARILQAVCAPQPLVCGHWLDVVSGGNICDALTVFTARVHIRQHCAADNRHVVSSCGGERLVAGYAPQCG